MKRKRSKKTGHFVQLHNYMLSSAAWCHLSLGARCTYLVLKQRYNGGNNGRLALSTRDAGELLGKSRSSADRYLDELERHGFIKRQSPTSFHQKRLATEYALTELRNDVTQEPPTKDFMRWDEKKPVPKQASTVPPAGQNEGIDVTGTAYSPAHEPVERDQSGGQSHGWDTYTSTPEGALELSALIDVWGPVVRRQLERHGHAASRSVTPTSLEITERLLKHTLDDPLFRVVVESFPGAEPRFTVADINEAINQYLNTADADGVPAIGNM